MPPQIALTLCLAFILYSLWQDIKESRGISHALWIPFTWIAISASKPVTLWLYPRFGASALNAQDYVPMGGNATERNTLIVMMVLGLIVLYKRRTRFSFDFKKNSWLWLFFFYMLMSISWSDYQGISFKRWLRAVGDIIIVLVILTEHDEREAVERLLRRCAIILIPLSVLFIKYFRYIGVAFDPWGESFMYVGVTQHKNHLGQLCAFLGIFLIWRILKARPKIILLDVLLVIPMIYLLFIIDSITSLVVFIVGIVILFFDQFLKSDLRRINRAVIGVFLGLVVLQVLLVSFAGDSLLSHFFSVTHRSETLTDRVPLWKDLIQMVSKQPFTGKGFGGFWLSDQITVLWNKYPWGPLAAHNGYIDIFLDLGIIGLLIFFLAIIQGYQIVLHPSEENKELQTLQLAFLIMILLDNFTESTLLKASSFPWQFFLLFTIRIERKDISSEAPGALEPPVTA